MTKLQRLRELDLKYDGPIPQAELDLARCGGDVKAYAVTRARIALRGAEAFYDSHALAASKQTDPILKADRLADAAVAWRFLVECQKALRDAEAA